MTERELALRSAIMRAFAATGEPPPVDDHDTLRSLADRHVVALDDAGHIVMAHPFADHREGTQVTSGARTWWGSCAWDGLGIVAALGLMEAELSSGGVALEVRDGRVAGGDGAAFHVLVPAREWWDDIAHT
jgi:Alkylmercury lyase